MTYFFQSPEWADCSLNRRLADDQNQKVVLADIDPAIAAKILSLNFENNRPASKRQIKKLASDMKEGRWSLVRDAITISQKGFLVNGQHRLEAVIESGTTQSFIFFFGATDEAVQLLDIGRKRTMEQRITISGIRITARECAATRAAMNTYEHRSLGSLEYSQPNHDSLVADTYLKHKEFLRLTSAHKSKGNALYYAVALKMYAEMVHHGHEYIFDHDHDPLTRCRLFLDICIHGSTQDPSIRAGLNENAANRLVRYREDYKHKHISFFTSKPAWRLAATAAYKFMTGTPVTNLQPSTFDPFYKFIDLPTTNTENYDQPN